MKTTFYYIILFIVFSFVTIQAKGTSLVSNKNEPKNLASLDINTINSFDMIVKAQEKYITKSYPHYRILHSFYLKDTGTNRLYEVVSCINEEEKGILVSFDMTEIYKKLKRKDKETREKIEEIESSCFEFSFR